LLSWIINLILAFVIVKFLVYPGLGLLFNTPFPVVAVVSSSMEHNSNFDGWWENNKDYYFAKQITKDQFETFDFHHGFNKGDIMVLQGVKEYNIGDILVYSTTYYNYPIIHRIIEKDPIITKGDNNNIADPKEVSETQIQGKAIVKIPLLGWIKIWFNDVLKIFTGGI